MTVYSYHLINRNNNYVIDMVNVIRFLWGKNRPYYIGGVGGERLSGFAGGLKCCRLSKHGGGNSFHSSLIVRQCGEMICKGREQWTGNREQIIGGWDWGRGWSLWEGRNAGWVCGFSGSEDLELGRSAALNHSNKRLCRVHRGFLR